MVPSFVNVLIIRDNKGRYQNTSPTNNFSTFPALLDLFGFWLAEY